MRLTSISLKMALNSKQNQATRLAYLRETLGFTLRQVGEAVGRSSSRIVDWESDPAIRLKKDVLEKLAKLYKVSPDFIIYGDQGAPKEHQELKRAISADRGTPTTDEVLALLYIKLPFIAPTAYGTFAINCQDFHPDEFDECYVLRIPGVDYKNAVVMSIRGNSMSPRYPESSRYVIRPVSNGNWQYATGVHGISLRSGMFIIKRITSNKDGLMTLTSDNGGDEITVQLGDILCMWKVGEAAYLPAED